MSYFIFFLSHLLSEQLSFTFASINPDNVWPTWVDYHQHTNRQHFFGRPWRFMTWTFVDFWTRLNISDAKPTSKYELIVATTTTIKFYDQHLLTLTNSWGKNDIFFDLRHHWIWEVHVQNSNREIKYDCSLRNWKWIDWQFKLIQREFNTSFEMKCFCEEGKWMFGEIHFKKCSKFRSNVNMFTSNWYQKVNFLYYRSIEESEQVVCIFVFDTFRIAFTLNFWFFFTTTIFTWTNWLFIANV